MNDTTPDPSAHSHPMTPPVPPSESSPPPPRRRGRGKLFFIGFLIGGVLFAAWRWSQQEEAAPSASPTPVALRESDSEEALTELQDLAGVLTLAQQGLDNLEENVDDYTARMIKQERVKGELQPAQEMVIKVQTRRRVAGELVRPMRVYLRFVSPDDVDGREVIWAEDRHDGKLVAHEAGFKGLIPVPPLDPTGMLAMMGNRYPITQIGMTNLVRKLIERGERDLDDPQTSVVTTQGHQVGDRRCTLIRVVHAKPDGSKDDFAVAEIAIDSERNIPLRYTAFGWPDPDKGKDAERPLLESYTYLDVELNVGLTDRDFDRENPEYNFP